MKNVSTHKTDHSTGNVSRPETVPPTVETDRGAQGLPAPAGSGKAAPRVHLGFLDGLRGLAVLYVLFFHARLTRLPEMSQTGLKGLFTNWLIYGHLAVDVFIVLSGFCLMLPVARRGELTGGAVAFFKKRARRILPPFFAAVVFGVIINAALFHLFPHEDFKVASLTTVVANMLLLQDIHPAYNSINGAFWSVAVEWKIYFLFPVLVWVWRKRGAGGMLAAAVGIGYGLTGLLYLAHNLYLVNGHGGLSLTCPWYVALFGLGMWAGARSFGAQPIQQFDAKWKAGTAASIALLVVLLAVFAPHGDNLRYYAHFPLIDAAAGLVTAMGLLWLGMKSRSGETTPAHRVLSWGPLAFVGSFGYSIYLMHVALLHIYISLMHTGAHHGVSTKIITVSLPLVVLPLILLLCYGFFLLFEKPFMSPQAASAARAAGPAASSRPAVAGMVARAAVALPVLTLLAKPHLQHLQRLLRP